MQIRRNYEFYLWWLYIQILDAQKAPDLLELLGTIEKCSAVLYLGVLNLALKIEGYIPYNKRRKTNVQYDKTFDLEIEHNRWSEGFC